MIKEQIRLQFKHQYDTIENFTDNIFVADYTNQTNHLRDVEFFSPRKPIDIESFSISNDEKLSIDGIAFNNSSFVRADGYAKSQCEAVFFPATSTVDSWVLFCELKYSSKPENNEHNLKKAIEQVKKTRLYYIETEVISLENKCYLIASLPFQKEPFPNFLIPSADLLKMKREQNIILRLQNTVEIVDAKTITV